MLNELLGYVKGLNGSAEVKEWVQTVLAARAKKHRVNQEEAEHIIDYLMSDAAPVRLRRMSYDAALNNSMKWSKARQKKGKHIKETEEDTEVIHDFLDGTKIVRLLSKKAYEREGFLMAHCVGGYDPKNSTIYSYRDIKNMPHATFEVAHHQGEIVQIKGKGNGAIHPKYVHPILTFLETIGLNIRSRDMSNLGYYTIPSDALPLVTQFVDMAGKSAPFVVIKGVKYLYGGVVAT